MSKSPVDASCNQRCLPLPSQPSHPVLPTTSPSGSSSSRAMFSEDENFTEKRATEKPDLNLLPTDPAIGDGEDAVVTGDPGLTDEIESSMVNLSVDDVIEMPFVKPNGGYLVGSLLQKRRFNARAMERLMIEKLWNPLYVVQMQEIEHNLFLFGFEHQMDLNKVIREGPWRFNKHMLILKEIDTPSKAVRSSLRKIPIWEHIGPVLEVDPDSAGTRGLGYLRVRVEIEAGAPIPRGLSIGMGGSSKTLGFRFEILENYCFRCGYLDHIEDDCVKAYDPAMKDKVGWRMDYTALPPIKRFSRQQPAHKGAQIFCSVSPIEGSVWTPRPKEPERSLVPYEAQILDKDRSMKRPCLNAISAPPGFENGSDLDSSKDGIDIEVDEKNVENQVGDDARLGE